MDDCIILPEDDDFAAPTEEPRLPVVDKKPQP